MTDSCKDQVTIDFSQVLSVIEGLATQLACVAFLLPKGDVRTTSEAHAEAAMGYVGDLKRQLNDAMGIEVKES